MTTGISFQNGSYLGGTAGANTSFGNTGVTSFFNQEYLDSKYSYQQAKEGYEIEQTATDATISKQLSVFQKYMEEHREDEAMDAYHKLIDVMKGQSRYQNLDDEALAAVAEQIITSYLSEQKGEEVDLVKYIQDNAANASERSWQKTFLNNSKIDEITEEDLLNEICGMQEEKSVSAGQYVLEVLATPVKIFTEIGDFLFGGKHH